MGTFAAESSTLMRNATDERVRLQAASVLGSTGTRGTPWNASHTQRCSYWRRGGVALTNALKRPGIRSS